MQTRLNEYSGDGLIFGTDNTCGGAKQSGLKLQQLLICNGGMWMSGYQRFAVLQWRIFNTIVKPRKRLSPALMLCQKVGVNNVYRSWQCRMFLLPLWLHRVSLEGCTLTVYAVECCYSHLLPREGCYSYLPPREGLTLPSTPGRSDTTFYPGKVLHNLLPWEGLTLPSTLFFLFLCILNKSTYTKTLKTKLNNYNN